MTYDAFISYRRSDRITADGVARFLDAFGLKVFVDRSSRAGTAWEPELRAALASAKVLVVLWSRSAAHSNWVEQEWRNVSPDCRIVPLKLDGEPLPEDLNRLTAVEGLDVGSRLLQRTFELMQQGKLSPAEAQEQLVQELAADGVVLEPKQREALGIFLGFLAGLAGVGALTLGRAGELGRAAQAADSLPPSANTTPPPAVGKGKWASLLGGAGGLTVAAFLTGYFWHGGGGGTPANSSECPPPSVAATSAAAAPCPEAPACPQCEPAQAPACPCTAQQCARNATPAADVKALRDELQGCQKQLTTTRDSLRACVTKGLVRTTAVAVQPRSIMTAAPQPNVAAGGAASTPALR